MLQCCVVERLARTRARHRACVTVPEFTTTGAAPLVWPVGALCRAVADALAARFNPVAVRGELSGFSRAASGHCYFNLKDEGGQIRCAMFRRAATLVDFDPVDGELVEVRGRLGVYEARGDLQLVVESMSRAGQGVLFEQFLRLKAKLEAEGLYEATRKRPLPVLPRAIGLVTSPGAAALHDVVTALRRRVPHIPVLLAPASVQGTNAPAEIVAALKRLYQVVATGVLPIDVILLVRGGGSLEDLWAFNDEGLARALVLSPVPVVCGVGHETDFTIADFVADVRAPTPTAAAELVAEPRSVWLEALEQVQDRLREALEQTLDLRGQHLDLVARRLGRPSALVAQQVLMLTEKKHHLRTAVTHDVRQHRHELDQLRTDLPQQFRRGLLVQRTRLDRAALRLALLDPSLVLQRGYAWLSDQNGGAISSTRQTFAGQRVLATLADGKVDLAVLPRPEK